MSIMPAKKLPSLGVSTDNPNQKVTRIENTAFQGKPAKKVYIKNLTINKESAMLYLPFGPSYIQISPLPIDKNSDYPVDRQYIPVIEKILNTFRWTD